MKRTSMNSTFFCDERTTVTVTGGQLRGFCEDGVYHFKGIKYADAERFCMPQPVAPWEGVKDALNYGYICPELSFPHGLPSSGPGGEDRLWGESEHCQYLNVWTSTLSEGAKLPVLVYLHGGGYVGGSSVMHRTIEGKNLAKNDGVVTVSLNHRLNVFGHLDVSDYGEKYENSGNAGFADLVAALQWVHDNIASFGGDPDCVTIFGQSGGGGKVSALLQIPAAEGLFHRAYVMSGIIQDDNVLVRTTAPAKMIVEEIMREMGLGADEFERFLTAPYVILTRAAERAQMKLKKRGYATGWGPKNNGWYRGSLCLSGRAECSLDVPVMVGTCFSEFGGSQPTKNKSEMTAEERRAVVAERYGEKTDELLQVFKKAYPLVNEVYAAQTDTFFRKDTRAYVMRRAAEAKAPVYNYVFALEKPMDGGAIASHCDDIAFALRNTDYVPFRHVQGELGADCPLTELFPKLLVQFARTGDPNIPELPAWLPCSGDRVRSMVFDRVSQFREDHDGALVQWLLDNTPAWEPVIVGDVPEGETWKY